MTDVTTYVGADVSTETLIALNQRCETLGFVLYALPVPGDLWHVSKLTARPAIELDTLSGINPGAPGLYTSNRQTTVNENGESKTMANVSQLAESPWLKGEDLNNRTVTVTIAGASIEPMKQADGKTENKVVVSFVGKRKKMICNTTQLRSLIQATGSDDTDYWIGKQIMLSPGVSNNGKPTVVVLPPAAADDGESFATVPAAAQMAPVTQMTAPPPIEDNPFN